MEMGVKEYQKYNVNQFDLIINGIKDEIDIVNQICIVEQMIVLKVDVIVIVFVDLKVFVLVVKKVVDVGIIVVNIDNWFDFDVLKLKNLNVLFVGLDNCKGVCKIGDYFVKWLKVGDQVGIVEGVLMMINVQQCMVGFQDVMKVGGMKVVLVQLGEWEIDKGNVVVVVMFNEYLNLKVLLCGNDNMVIGVVLVVCVVGKQGKVFVVGYDNINVIKLMLKDGCVFVIVDQYVVKQVVFGIDMVFKVIVEYCKQVDMFGVVEMLVDFVMK